MTRGPRAARPGGASPARSRGGLVLAVGLCLATACEPAASGDEGRAPAPDPAAGTPAPSPFLPPVNAGSLEVGSAVVAEPVTGERTAAYLTVHNRGAAADVLEGLASPVAGRAALHRSETRGGVTSMGPAGPVEVAAGAELRLAPGGLHGMLEELTEVAAGDTVTLVLRFRDAGEVAVPALVVAYAELDALFPPPPGGGHDAHGGTP